MQKPAKKHSRCAIYTRKSTEHNLDLEFNSLDAQRESCEAYIKSQAHEGWRLIPDRYDDGAFSGASLERPALQQLLADVRSGRVDIIVVYKIDRLTRALADFAKLVELFDQHVVTFVSVTQQFSTTTSMGRLTLNVLLSFAQFEREVIGERVRDKIAASKAKGLWMGGRAPLGYINIGKKLVIVPEEAETVRIIFQRYLKHGSIGRLAEDLHRSGIRSRPRPYTADNAHAGVRYGVGHLATLLKNRAYAGEVFYRGVVYPGEHEPVVDRAVFENVQATLAASAVDRQLRLKTSSSILTGRIFDDRGNRMTPTHANKQGARYRYYVSHAILQKQTFKGSGVARVPAAAIEDVIVQALHDRFLAHGGHRLPSSTSNRDLIDRHVKQITIKSDAIEIFLTSNIIGSAECEKIDGIDEPRFSRESSTAIVIPWSTSRGNKGKVAVHTPQSHPTIDPMNKQALLIAIAKARTWIKDIVEGRTTSFSEIAKREGRTERHVRNLADLAFSSPSIVSGIMHSPEQENLTVTQLTRDMPYLWSEQYNKLQLVSHSS